MGTELRVIFVKLRKNKVKAAQIPALAFLLA